MKTTSPASETAPGLLGRIRRSILPDPVFPRTGSERKRFLLRNLVLHFRPTTVPEATLRFTLTWALGGAAVVLVFLQLGTGVLLKFAYDPSPGAAYASVQTLMQQVSFGPLVRNLHFWCANLLVAVAFLHMLRVFFTGAFHAPRQFNWIVGWVLFSLLLASNFTGYLLPFDQFAYWAVTVSTGMLAYIPAAGSWLQQAVRGGVDIGPGTLRLFFALHTALLPAVIVVLMAFHFWRIRKAGGLVVPRTAGDVPETGRVPTIPHLLIRETVAALTVIAFVLLLSVFFDAPLGDPANPGLSPNPTKAPWYFAGFQELLLHLHPAAAVFWLPLGGALFLAAVPYLNYPKNPAGVWFASEKGRRLAAVFAFSGFAAAILAVIAKEGMVTDAAASPMLDVGVAVAVPLLFAFVYLTLRRRSVDANESVQAIFTMAAAAFIALTLIGVFFRGAGMKLGFY